MRIGISAMWLSSAADTRNSGLSRYALNLIDRMTVLDSDHEFVAFVPAAFDIPPQWLTRPALQIFQVDVPALRQRVLWEHMAATKFVSRHRLDVWFSTAHVIPVRCSVPTAVMLHDVIPLLFPEHHVRRTVVYYRWAMRDAARRASLIFANSECTKRDVVKLFNVSADKVTVTPLGPGILAQPNAAEYAALEIREPYIFTLGNREWRKNLHGLLDAFAQLKSDVHLVIGGGKRPTSDDLVSAKIKELGISDRVQLLGFVPDGALPQLYSRARAFVFPSLYEGFGLPVLEAMSYGALVACSDRSSIPEVAGGSAFYFDPSSTASIVSAIDAALQAPDREQRVQRGLKRAATFNWDRTARETIAALERLG